MIKAVAVQPRIHLPYPSADRFDDGAITANLNAAVNHVKRAKAEFGADLVALPEFFLTGYTLGVDIDGWIKASIKIPGPETAVLSEIAIKEGVYIAATAYEVDDQFPGRFFNTAFVIAPNGDLILRYRKLYAMTTKTRPIDILDEFLDKFGPESLFPVVDTPIGRIGALIARDAHWPEVARCLALKGAEILYNPNAAGVEPDDGGRFVRQSRAYENHCYLISPNIGPFVIDGEDQETGGRAPCEIINYQGQIMAREEQSTELMVTAELDIESLRRFRSEAPGKGNFLAQLQPQIHIPVYNSADLFPSNAWRDTPMQSGDENKSLEAEVIKKMLKNDVIRAPMNADN